MRLDPTQRWRRKHIELFLLTPELVTERYVAWLNDPEVSRYLESRFVQHEVEDVRAFVTAQLESEAVLFLGIYVAELGRHVGNIKIGPLDRRHGLGEIGIMIGDRAAWGRGVATEAIVMMSEIGFAELGLRKITAGCYASNVGSKRAFEKAGFAVEAVRPAHFLLNGLPEDAVLLGRLRTPAEERPSLAW